MGAYNLPFVMQKRVCHALKTLTNVKFCGMLYGRKP